MQMWNSDTNVKIAFKDFANEIWKLNGYSAVLRNWAAQICYSSSQINGTKSSNMDLSVSVRARTIVDDAVVSWFCKSLSAMEWGQIKLNLFVVFGTWCRQSIPVFCVCIFYTVIVTYRHWLIVSKNECHSNGQIGQIRKMHIFLNILETW